MMWVRYPNGICIQYNNANFLQHDDNSTWILRKKEGSDPIAFIQASAGAIVEFEKACRVDNPLTTITETVLSRIEINTDRIKRLVTPKTKKKVR